MKVETPGARIPGASLPGPQATPDVHLNLNVRGLLPSATVAINELSDQLRREGRTVFKMGLGQSPFPVPGSVVAELKRHAAEKDYLPVRGLAALRRAVAQQIVRERGLECDADDVIVGPGSKELMFILQLVYYGDLVVPSPAWVSYIPQARIVGRQVHQLHTEARRGWKVTPEQLDAFCRSDAQRPRLLILNYPSNPTGTSYDQDELAELAEVARRYRLTVLADEIYARLDHFDRHASIAPLHPDGTIISTGLSKWCGAGGWRLGVFVFPQPLRWLSDAMAVVASETYTSTSAPIQHAAVRAFEGGQDIETYLDGCRRVLRGLAQALVTRLRAAGARVAAPAGGFYLFPDVRGCAGVRRRGLRTSAALCRQLLEETGVAVLPGSDFGRDPKELTLRLAYVNFEGAKALEGLDSFGRDREVDEAFLAEHCGECVRGIDLFCEWLS